MKRIIEPVEIGAVRPPVVGVSPKSELLPALPALDEERAASDRPRRSSGCRSGRSRPSRGPRRGAHARAGRLEEVAPAGEAGAQHDPDRLRVDGRTLRMTRWGRIPPGLPCRRIARCVKTKSGAVIGTPSLQRASGRMRYVSVNGGFVVIRDVRDELGRYTCRRRPRTPTRGPAERSRRAAAPADCSGCRARSGTGAPRPARRGRACRRASASAQVAPPAPETARSETAIAAARASGRATSSPRSRAGSRGVGAKLRTVDLTARPLAAARRAGSPARPSPAARRLGSGHGPAGRRRVSGRPGRGRRVTSRWQYPV